VADSLEVIGANGILRVESSNGGFEQWSDKGRESPDLAIHHQFIGQSVGALHNELAYLCDCIRRNQPPDHVPFAAAIHGLEVAEAIVQSAKTGEVVTL
jgi:predicted dehydrogenase